MIIGVGRALSAGAAEGSSVWIVWSEVDVFRTDTAVVFSFATQARTIVKKCQLPTTLAEKEAPPSYSVRPVRSSAEAP